MPNDDQDRAARLAEQLRANLRKRKQQARGRPAAEALAGPEGAAGDSHKD